MKIIQEYAHTKLRSLGASLVVLGRDHDHTPFIITIKAQGELAVEQDPINGIYCKDLKTAEMVIRKTITIRGL